MKKIASLFVILFLVLCLASCDFNGNNGNQMTEEIDSTELMDILEPDSMVQCVAITKAGTQCQRLVKYPDTLCFQHYRMMMQSDTE